LPYQSLLQEIYQKLQKLVKEHDQLKKENLRLKAILEQKENKELLAKEDLRLAKDQLAVLRAGGKDTEGAGKKEMEKRINQYIREIDKAIALLNV